MELRFTRHAKNRNRKIQATTFEILECIENPDSYYIQADGKEIAIKALGNKLASSIMKCNTWESRKGDAILSVYGKTIQTSYYDRTRTDSQNEV